MTDLGAEAAFDAEHGQPHVEFLEWVVETYRRQGLPPALARFFNLGSLPEEKKVPKTSAKKREYKSRYNRKIEDLRKKANKQKSKYQESNKKLQTERTMERATNILDRIEKDKHLLENVLASMEKKNIQMDKNCKERVAATSREIEKIKNNINHMNELVKFNKTAIDRETQTWKNKEAQAKTDMKKSIEELNNTKEQMQERIKSMKQHVAEEEDRIGREIQNTSNIKKNIEAKKNTLSMIRDNIRKKNEEEAEKIAEYDALIKKLKNDELYEKEKADSNIAAKYTELIEIKKQMEKNLTDFDRKIQQLKDDEEEETRKMKKDIETRLKTLNMAKEESEKRIQDLNLKMTERKRAIDAEIKHLEEEEAQQKLNMVKNLNIMQNKYAKSKEEYEEKLKAIQQIEAEKQSQVKDRIQNNEKEFQKSLESMGQREAEKTREIQRIIDNQSLVKGNIAQRIEALQNSLAKTEEEFEKDIMALRQQEEEIKAKHKKVVEIKAQKKENIEKNIEALHKKFGLNKKGVSIGGTSSVLYTGERPRDLYFSRPSTSSDIGPIDLTDKETELPSNSANDAASCSRWPRFWQRSRSDRD